ncbi:hypothetical protein [Pararobbsia silviterrae]|uniref:Aldose 1-epimerase n=1 Tax=Pararobbsia silviterrae TaxID=1792498 RepID=A0A494XA23_9BURK|nr:hypothetical protein [Pararobbsia silviterrae]RKP44423.1 hypothetical protein D7S86_27505 [Pararobbsia silviterrae]
MERWTLKWAYGEAQVQSLGGMIAPVRFDIGSGRSVSPLHVAPWKDEPPLTGLLRALRGEWPCLPFGMVKAPDGLPSDFKRREASDPWDHGYGANHMWQRVSQTEHALTLSIACPPDSDIDRLERTIEVDPNSPAISVSLTVHARHDVVLPFALHPTFAVPEGGVEVLACPHGDILSYPVPQEPGVSRIEPNVSFLSLAQIPTAFGLMDATRLPLPVRTEELMQISDCRPPFVLRYPRAQAEVFLDWNADELPDALLWISNGGRQHAPWRGEHFALGVEPANSFFDLGRVAQPSEGHPLSNRTGVLFRAGRPRTIRYRLSARDCHVG